MATSKMPNQGKGNHYGTAVSLVNLQDYTAPSDGYLSLEAWASDSTAYCHVYDSDSSYNFPIGIGNNMGHAIYATALYVKKGMTIHVEWLQNGGSVKFIPMP